MLDVSKNIQNILYCILTLVILSFEIQKNAIHILFIFWNCLSLSFTDTYSGPLRPGTVEDVKSTKPQHLGHHMAMDIDTYMKKPPNSYKAPAPPNSYKTPAPHTFKPPKMTYEGFIPCSPPKCHRVHPTSKKVVSSQVYHTTSPSPPLYKLHASKATTKVPTIYRTTTQHTSYRKPTENIQNGYLVDHHSDNDISNVIGESPNLCKLIKNSFLAHVKFLKLLILVFLKFLV